MLGRSPGVKGNRSGCAIETVAVSSVRLVEPKPACIIDDLVAAFLDRDRLEEVVIDQDDKSVAAGERAVEVDQLGAGAGKLHRQAAGRSEEHTSELPSLMRRSYAVLC